MKCNVPCVPGTPGPVERYEEVKAFTDEHGFPIIIKAALSAAAGAACVPCASRSRSRTPLSARRARPSRRSATAPSSSSASSTARATSMVQLLGDNFGNVVHLYWSATAASSGATRRSRVGAGAGQGLARGDERCAILKDAVRLAQSVNYRNAGTAEFLVDQKNRYYFIEINPRMQVLPEMSTTLTRTAKSSTPITEEITGIDIVAAQIQIAAGASLGPARPDPRQDLDARLRHPVPRHHRGPVQELLRPTRARSRSTGRPAATACASTRGKRLLAGSIISPHYDSMLVKCTCHGSTYEIARRKMLRALVEFRIRGVKTNVPFLASLLTHPTFVEGDVLDHVHRRHVSGLRILTDIADKPSPELFSPHRQREPRPEASRLPRRHGRQRQPDQGSDRRAQAPRRDQPAQDQPPDGTPVDTSAPCKKGWRNVLVQHGPKAFARAIRKNPGCLIMDTTWRDAHQSLLAARGCGRLSC